MPFTFGTGNFKEGKTRRTHPDLFFPSTVCLLLPCPELPWTERAQRRWAAPCSPSEPPCVSSTTEKLSMLQRQKLLFKGWRPGATRRPAWPHPHGVVSRLALTRLLLVAFSQSLLLTKYAPCNCHTPCVRKQGPPQQGFFNQ